MTSTEHPATLRESLHTLLNNKVVITLEVLAILLILSISLLSGATTYVVLLFGWLSLWLRRTGWKSIGMSSPPHWGNTVALGLVIGIGWSLMDVFVVSPFIVALTGHPLDYSLFQGIEGNVISYLIMLVVVWTFVPFGEEMVYRGYLLNRLSNILGQSPLGWTAGLLLVSTCFGLAHSYQGLTGVVLTGYVAFVLGLVYFATGRNLWLPILIHAAYDTAGITLLFLGLDPALNGSAQ